MTDHELLELAAEAAGVEIKVVVGDTFWTPDGITWNPLADDADALRLAVKLNLLVLPYPKDNAVRVTRLGLGDAIVSFGTPPDPYDATRRAIVRAAASIVGPHT